MDYEELADLTDEEIEADATLSLPDDALRTKLKRDLWDLQKERNRIDQGMKAIRICLSDPENASKMLDITAYMAQQITSKELTTSNVGVVPYDGLEDEDKQFFKDHSGNLVYGLHNKLMENPKVKEGVTKLKENGTLDMRKQRHKNKPNAYIDNLANHKLIADLAKRQKEADERLARLELAQQENNSKFEQIGAALLLQESKVDALIRLGVDTKKIEAYKLHISQPQMTRQELADALGKSKPTIIKWLHEVQDEIAKSKQ